MTQSSADDGDAGDKRGKQLSTKGLGKDEGKSLNRCASEFPPRRREDCLIQTILFAKGFVSFKDRFAGSDVKAQYRKQEILI